MRLFLDVEWADLAGSQLVSLALVDATGEHRFYAEIYPLPPNPTNFVQHVVYPLLDHGWYSMPAHEFTRQLRGFLANIPDPIVLFDHEQDGHLFRRVLDGFSNKPDDTSYGPLPAVNTTLMQYGDVIINIERYFEDRPEAKARRHHALVDAEALAWAFTVALKEGMR